MAAGRRERLRPGPVLGFAGGRHRAPPAGFRFGRGAGGHRFRRRRPGPGGDDGERARRRQRTTGRRDRRLPPDRQRRRSPGHGASHRPVPDAIDRRAFHACRPTVPPRSLASPQPDQRGTRPRSPLRRGRGRSTVGRRRRNAGSGRARRSLRPNRRMGSRPGVGRSLTGTGTGSSRVRGCVPRRRSPCRQLPQRRTARHDGGQRSPAPARDGSARPADRLTGRRRHRVHWRDTVAHRHRQPQPTRRPARQHRRVVPLPPPPPRSAVTGSKAHLPRTATRTSRSRRGLVRVARRPRSSDRAPARRRRCRRGDVADAHRRSQPPRPRTTEDAAGAARADRRHGGD